MSRLLALLILVIPGAISALGIKLMRDTLFGHTIKPFSALWLKGCQDSSFLRSASMCWPGSFYTETENAIKSARDSENDS